MSRARQKRSRDRNEVTAITADTALAYRDRPPWACGHGAACHDGTESAVASAPAHARAWLLAEHPGPWPEEAVDAHLPGPLRKVVDRADELGIRVQLIRRPGRRNRLATPAVYVGWTSGPRPWLRGGDLTDVDALAGELDGLAEGHPPTFGAAMTQPLLLVCAHGRRDVCCARLGVPLARQLARTWPAEVWETTHVGGHRFAANLVILPHGLYYGPVAGASAEAAVTAYQRGEVALDRYRGRAGQPQDVQHRDYLAMKATGGVALAHLT
jgi:hypothetical protein